jgi:hypothetical protein
MIGALVDLVFWLMIVCIVFLAGSTVGKVVALLVLAHWLVGGGAR